MPERATSFRQALRPFRRRLQFVQMVESLPVAVSLGIALAATILLAARPEWQTSAIVLATGLLSGALIASLKTVVAPPSLERTATTLDREYALESYAVTALHFDGATDRISQRIVIDACTRLDGLDRRQLRWSLSPRAWWSATVAVVALAGVLAISGGP